MAGLGRDERSWLRAARAGSLSDLEALFRAHWPRAYRAAYLVCHDHAAAEDIAQEAFLAAVRGLDAFDAERPFGPWLHRLVLERAIDRTKARLTRQEVAGESYLENTQPGGWYGVDGSPLPHVDTGTRAVAVGLVALGPDERAALVARFVLDYAPREIAELLELPRGTATARLRNAVDGLESSLRETPA